CSECGPQTCAETTCGIRSIDAKLLQGLDSLKVTPFPSSRPVLDELVAMQRRPSADEAQDAGRQFASQQPALDGERGLATTARGMEVRRAVLVVVHRDHDSVELRDARHVVMTGAPATRFRRKRPQSGRSTWAWPRAVGSLTAPAYPLRPLHVPA